MPLNPGLTTLGSDIGNVKVENASGTVINPATEETLEKIPGLWVPESDYIAVTYPSGTQEVYTYFIGGSGGTQTATITVNYTDATKANISNVGITKP